MSTTGRAIAMSLLGWVFFWTTGGSDGAGYYKTKAACEAAGRQAAKRQADFNAKIEERTNPDSASWEGGTLEWKCYEQRKPKTKTSDSR
jgi:hypothetical protein